MQGPLYGSNPWDKVLKKEKQYLAIIVISVRNILTE